jgi:hypothetical protein
VVSGEMRGVQGWRPWPLVGLERQKGVSGIRALLPWSSGKRERVSGRGRSRETGGLLGVQVGPRYKLIQWLSKIRREGEDLGIDAQIHGMAGSFFSSSG